MTNRDGLDRYNWEHRKDPDFTIGESMPGTVGDSGGTLHDRLGDQPYFEEDVEVFEPGQKAREREEESNSKTSQGGLSIKDLVERL